MKPTCPKDQLNSNAREFPLVASNYHAIALPNFGGSCARRERHTFRNISGDYFRNEARGEFCSELVAFAAIVMTAAVPLISNAHALADFLRAIGSL